MDISDITLLRMGRELKEPVKLISDIKTTEGVPRVNTEGIRVCEARLAQKAYELEAAVDEVSVHVQRNRVINGIEVVVECSVEAPVSFESLKEFAKKYFDSSEVWTSAILERLPDRTYVPKTARGTILVGHTYVHVRDAA